MAKLKVGGNVEFLAPAKCCHSPQLTRTQMHLTNLLPAVIKSTSLSYALCSGS